MSGATERGQAGAIRGGPEPTPGWRSPGLGPSLRGRATVLIRGSKRRESKSRDELRLKSKSPGSLTVRAGILCLAALGLACSSGSQKDVRPLVPAIATTGSPVYRPGSFVWFDLLVDDAAGAEQPALREAGLALLAAEQLWFLAQNGTEAELMGEIAGGVSNLLAGDLDSDRQTEIVAYGAAGLRLFDRADGGQWRESGLGGVELVISNALRRLP